MRRGVIDLLTADHPTAGIVHADAGQAIGQGRGGPVVHVVIHTQRAVTQGVRRAQQPAQSVIAVLRHLIAQRRAGTADRVNLLQQPACLVVYIDGGGFTAVGHTYTGRRNGRVTRHAALVAAEVVPIIRALGLA